jgi:V/A-type H+/Na+-transporting ATPase subunit F
MYKAAVIGDTDSVIGFKALGLVVLEAATPDAAGELLRQTVEDGFAIVFITEPCYAWQEDYIQTLAGRRYPAIIPIPAADGSRGLGMRRVREAVRKAVGMDMPEQVSQDSQNDQQESSDWQGPDDWQ